MRMKSLHEPLYRGILCFRRYNRKRLVHGIVYVIIEICIIIEPLKLNATTDFINCSEFVVAD